MGSPSVGLLGKAPCQADFLRVQATEPVCQHFHRWLEEGMQHLRQAGNPPLPRPSYFLFSQPGEARVLVGALVPSEDEVGRSFPLALFVALDAEAVRVGFPGLSVSLQPFLEGAAAVLNEAPSLDVNALGQRLRALPVPSAATLSAAAGDARQALMSSRTEDLLLALAPDGATDMPAYGLRTFLTACDNERAEPLKGSVTVACPLSATLGPWAWLELARKQLRPSLPPSFFWVEGAQPRLLLSMGKPTPAVLLYLAKAEHTSMKLWPLRTPTASAVAAAQKALSPAQRRGLEETHVTLLDAFASLAS